MGKKHVLMIIIFSAVFGGTGFWIFNYPKKDEVSLQGNQEDLIESLVAKYEDKIYKNPQDKFAYLDKADSQRQMGDAAAALETLEEAYTVVPQWRQNYDFLLIEARAVGAKSVEEGSDRYERLLRSDPTREPLYSEYISFLKRTGQPKEKVISVYVHLLQVIPQSRMLSEYEDYLKQNSLSK